MVTNSVEATHAATWNWMFTWNFGEWLGKHLLLTQKTYILGPDKTLENVWITKLNKGPISQIVMIIFPLVTGLNGMSACP